jgi:hypothetical protein
LIKRIAESRIGKLPSWAATLLLTASILASPLARPLLAQERPNASPASLGDRWEFLVAPYLLFPYMSGTTTIRGIEAEVDANPGDIFSRLQFGAMLFFEAHNSVWAASLDGLYMNLSQPGPLGLTEVGMKQGMVELTGYRRVMPWLEVLAGGRLNVLSGEIEILPIVPLPPEGPLPIKVDRSQTWFDPFVGARATVPAGRRWLFVFRGDVGGFGIGSDIAWQVYPAVSYRFSRLFGLAVAYRVLGMDYQTGSGTDAFRYDVRTFGPQIGFLFHF